MDMERIIALYMDDCHSRQLRPKTMQSYEQALKLFSTWLEEVHSITQVEDVKDIHSLLVLLGMVMIFGMLIIGG